MKNYLLALLFLIFVFFMPFIIRPSRLTHKDNDLGRTYIPIYNEIKTSFISDKELPLWSKRQMMGESEIATPLPSFFYPPNIIFILLPTALASVIYFALHLSISAITGFLLAKEFKFSNFASLVTALFYCFSLKNMLHISAGHITMVAAVSYLPLFFLAVVKLLSGADFKWVSIAAISSALLFITHPTIFYYGFIFVFAYVLYRSLIIFLGEKPDQYRKIYIRLAAALLLFLFLCAIALVPYLEFSSFSNRSKLLLEDIALPVWNQSRFIQSLVFPYLNLKDFDQESFLYMGFAPTVLALYAFSRLGRVKKFFIVLFGICTILFALGTSTPFFGFIYKITPFINYSRVTTRLWFDVILVGSLLSGYAVDKLKNRLVIYILLVLFVAESLFVFYNRLNRIPFLEFGNKDIYEFLKNDPDRFRVYCASSCFNPQILEESKIELLNGETPVQNADFINFLQKAGNYNFNGFAVIFPPYQVWQAKNPPIPESKILGEANVKYVASTYEITSPDFTFVNKYGNTLLYQNKNFKKRAYFLDSTKEVKISKETANYMSLNFEKSPQYSTLVIAENYFPGFEAKIDDNKYKIEAHENVFRKIVIPPNTSRVEIKYRPQSLIFGKTITLGSVFYMLMYFWYSRRRKAHG